MGYRPAEEIMSVDFRHAPGGTQLLSEHAGSRRPLLDPGVQQA
jgi:hypothetical protein